LEFALGEQRLLGSRDGWIATFAHRKLERYLKLDRNTGTSGDIRRTLGSLKQKYALNSFKRWRPLLSKMETRIWWLCNPSHISVPTKSQQNHAQ
jgi:hypothetical protein